MLNPHGEKCKKMLRAASAQVRDFSPSPGWCRVQNERGSATLSHGNNSVRNSCYGWPKVVRGGLGMASFGPPAPDLLCEQPYPTTLTN